MFSMLSERSGQRLFGIFPEGGVFYGRWFSIMKPNNACTVFLCTALFCAVPAEAADGSVFSNAGVVAMVLGVAVLAFAMKKFME